MPRKVKDRMEHLFLVHPVRSIAYLVTRQMKIISIKTKSNVKYISNFNKCNNKIYS